jgi:hypothetical protein
VRSAQVPRRAGGLVSAERVSWPKTGFQCLASDALEQSANGTIDDIQLGSDFSFRVPVHAHFQDFSFLRTETGKQSFELIDEFDLRFRRGIFRQKFVQPFHTPVSLFGLEIGIAFPGGVVLDLLEDFVDGDSHQQLAQVVLVLDFELAVLRSAEKRPENRLNDVLGVNSAGKPLADPPPSKSNEAVQVLIHQLPGRVWVTGTPSGEGVGHERISSLVR